MKGEAPPAVRQPLFEASTQANGSFKRQNEEKHVGQQPSGVVATYCEKAAMHHEPAGECLVCYDTLEHRNYAEYTIQLPALDPLQHHPKIVANDKFSGGEDDNTSRGALVSMNKDPLLHASTGKMHSGGETSGPVASSSHSVTTAQNTVWYPAKFCTECIEELRSVQFQRYCDSVANTTCAREQRALLKRGPPVNLRDRMAFPESNDQEIQSLWYAADNTVRSAKLKGSLEGEKRQALWDRLQQFLIQDEEAAEEGEGKPAENP